MRLALALLAALSLFAGVGIWMGGGMHRGWTKTSVAVEKTEEITGIVYRDYEDKFVPGVEFPIAGATAALLLGGVALLLRPRSKHVG